MNIFNKSPSSPEVDVLCKNMEKDSAISPILPYIMHELSSDYTQHQDLILRIKIAEALIQNNFIPIENYLISLINLAITGINETSCEFIPIKDLAAKFLDNLIIKFTPQFPTLRQRLADHFSTIFLDKTQLNISRKVGSAIALSYIGQEIVKDVILPKIPELLARIYQRRTVANELADISKLKSILLKLSGECFNRDTYDAIQKTGSPRLPPEIAELYNNLATYFGLDLFIYSAR